MRFIDENIRLHINGLRFKAYLENSDVSYETREQQLPFAPVSFVNDTAAIRLLQKAKFTFNVLSEYRSECVQNYKNLLKLIQSIKPSYTIIDEQYVPNKNNINGYVSLTFDGLPLQQKSVKLHVTQFSYEINKEMGYLQIPQNELDNNKNPKKFVNGEPKLIPIAYKIDIEGKILQTFGETANVTGNFYTTPNVSINDVVGNIPDVASTPDDYKKKLYDIVEKVTGENIYQYPPNMLKEVLVLAKRMKDNYLVNLDDGTFSDKKWGCGMTPCDENEQEKQRRRDEYNKIRDSMMQIPAKKNNLPVETIFEVPPNRRLS